jgi:hypothetical protein
MKGLLGDFLLRASAPGQFLKAVMLGAEDITDTPRTFKNGDRVTIVMTSSASMLTGTITDAKGTPVTDAGIIIFSEDKALWRSNALRTRRTSTDPSGGFRVTGLLPGRYYAIAVPRDRIMLPGSSMDAAYYEELTKDATAFVIGENEQRVLELKLVSGSGG